MREGLLMSILFSGESKGFYRICYWYSMICLIANLYLANMFAFTNLALVHVLVSVITIRTWNRTSLSDSEQPGLQPSNRAWYCVTKPDVGQVFLFPSQCTNSEGLGTMEGFSRLPVPMIISVATKSSVTLSTSCVFRSVPASSWVMPFGSYYSMRIWMGWGWGWGGGIKWQLRSSLKFSCQLRNAKNWNFNPEILKMFLEFLIVNSFTFNWIKISNFQQAIKITDKITFSLITDKEPRF